MSSSAQTKVRKPRFPEKLTVTLFEWPFRFWVDSTSRVGLRHLVDVGAYGGNGECSCEIFTMSMARELKMGRAPGTDTRCKHIRCARVLYADLCIREHKRTDPRTREGGTR